MQTPLNHQAVRRIMPELKVRDFLLLLLLILSSLPNVLSRFRGVWLQTGYGLVNGFIDHLYAPLGTTRNYSAISNLHTLQITTASAKSFPAYSVFTSRSLATVLPVEILQFHVHRSSCHSRPCRTLFINSTITPSLFSLPCRAQLSQSQSYFMTGGLSPISSSWCQDPWDSRPEIFISSESLR
jgi:hypothetical protein